MTPEGRVKKMISSYLTELDNHLTAHGLELYYSMFVPAGYGKNNSLDYTICLAGHFVAIETKEPGKWLTPQQRLTCRNLLRAEATVFIISGPEGLDAFKRWVERNAPRFLDHRSNACRASVIS
jgi:hypothetical protein